MRNKLNYNINWGEYFRIDSSSPSGLVRIKNRVGRDIEKYNVGTKAFKKDGKPDTW